MAKIKYILILLFSIAVFSCEKVIEVDLNDAKPTIVIEGNLTRSPGLSEVVISKTANYFGNSDIEMVSNASVIIENDLGAQFILTEEEKGIYKSHDIYPQIGRTYTLTVEVDGKEYKAFSKLNPPVEIDSIDYYFEEGFAFIREGYYLKVYFSDPPGKGNYYRLKVYKNGNYENNMENFVIFDDRINDGQHLEVTVVQRVFKVGHTAKIELISLDKGAYEYFRSFQDLITTNPGSAAPANPTSNFTNGALGYFSAWSSNSISTSIEE